MTIPIVTVDAFTDVMFSGNPAAVCVLGGEEASEEWMQKVAREMNLAETAFLRRRGGGRTSAPSSFDLRWFSPTVEVDLCGHATLASAHTLWTEAHVPPTGKLSFHTRSGVLTAAQRMEKGEALIELDFPAAPEKPFKGPTDALVKALGVKPRYVGSYGSDYLVEVGSESAVRSVSPDFGLLMALPVRGVAVTSAPSASTKARGYDFVSRFFAPKVGINEDSVTGSAHCGLGPFWGRRLGKEDVLGYQASARGGTVRVVMRGARVMLLGRAVTVLRGTLQGDS